MSTSSTNPVAMLMPTVGITSLLLSVIKTLLTYCTSTIGRTEQVLEVGESPSGDPSTPSHTMCHVPCALPPKILCPTYVPSRVITTLPTWPGRAQLVTRVPGPPGGRRRGQTGGLPQPCPHLQPLLLLLLLLLPEARCCCCSPLQLQRECLRLRRWRFW